MANVLRFEAESIAAAYIEWDFAATPHATPVFGEIEVYFDGAQIAGWQTYDAQYGPVVGWMTGDSANELLLADEDVLGDYAWSDSQSLADGVGRPVTGGQWYTLRWSAVDAAATATVHADGVDHTYSRAGNWDNVNLVRFGLVNGEPDAVVYIRRIKLGTALGGSTLLNYNPATDTDPATFGFTVAGDVTVVADPTAGATLTIPHIAAATTVHTPTITGGGLSVPYIASTTTLRTVTIRRVGIGAQPTGVVISFDDPAYENAPTWSRLDA